MAARSPRSFALDLLIRGLRFFYLLWGGILLATLAGYNRIRWPSALWHWPPLYKFLAGRIGRGLVLGLGVAMCLAALFEVWEWVDRILVRWTRHHDR